MSTREKGSARPKKSDRRGANPAANESKSRFPKHTKLGPEMEAAIEYMFDPRGSEVD